MAELEFAGESFALAEKVGLMPLMRFAHVAERGVDAADMDGLAAIYDLLQNVISDGDWGRFQHAATRARSDADELLEVVKDAIALISERPTDRPTVSSDGPLPTNEPSVDDSSSRVIRRLEVEGRPSIAYMVRQAQDARSVVSA